MKILVTGNMGYVGPVVAAHLRWRWPKADLAGYDSAFFAHCTTTPEPLPEICLTRQVFGDIRDLSADALEGVDAIVHLAAISNDPMGIRFSEPTDDINYRATIRLAKEASKAGVSHFVFASSCSVYGYAENAPRKEGDDLNPLTPYARSKVASEAALAQLGGPMVTTCLRFSTACGMSPRLRLDLVLNDFVASAMRTGEITILSDGTPWRPLIDVADMALAIEWAIERGPDDGGRFLAVNVGADDHNFRVRDLADTVARHLPGTTVSVNPQAQPDRRSYQVDFGLYRKLAPDHQPAVSLDRSVEQLRDGIALATTVVADFRNTDAMRLVTLKEHVDRGRLTSALRWSNQPPRAADF